MVESDADGSATVINSQSIPMSVDKGRPRGTTEQGDVVGGEL